MARRADHDPDRAESHRPGGGRLARGDRRDVRRRPGQPRRADGCRPGRAAHGVRHRRRRARQPTAPDRVPRAVVGVQRTRGLHRRRPGRPGPGVRPAAAEPRPGRRGPDPPDRRQQHGRDVVAGAGNATARRDQLLPHPGLAGERPGPGERAGRQADPGSESCGESPTADRRRGRGVARRRRPRQRRRARARQRTRRVQRVPVVPAPPQARVRPRGRLQPERVPRGGPPLGRHPPARAAGRPGHRRAPLAERGAGPARRGARPADGHGPSLPDPGVSPEPQLPVLPLDRRIC